MSNVIDLDKWRSPASEYPRSRVGSAAIKTAWYKPAYYHCYLQNGHEFYRAMQRLYITTLTIDGKIWMVDDPPHWWGMEEHAKNLHGHVMCAGLGLGLMVHALTAKDHVDKITVVEQSQDVIDLISPLVPHDKLRIIHADFYRTDSTLIPDVDSILFDLYVGNGADFMSRGIQEAKWMVEEWDFPKLRIHGLINPLVHNIATEIAKGSHLRVPEPIRIYVER